jgi:hypothetical protein
VQWIENCCVDCHYLCEGCLHFIRLKICDFSIVKYDLVIV